MKRWYTVDARNAVCMLKIDTYNKYMHLYLWLGRWIEDILRRRVTNEEDYIVGFEYSKVNRNR